MNTDLKYNCYYLNLIQRQSRKNAAWKLIKKARIFMKRDDPGRPIMQTIFYWSFQVWFYDALFGKPIGGINDISSPMNYFSFSSFHLLLMIIQFNKCGVKLALISLPHTVIQRLDFSPLRHFHWFTNIDQRNNEFLWPSVICCENLEVQRNRASVR